MAEGREAVDFQQFYLQETKDSTSSPFALEGKVQRLSLSEISTWQYFFTKATDS
jgi:hypothetical protein